MRFCELHVLDLEEAFDVVTPSITFADRHTLDMGDLQLELTFFGKGHSRSDILVYIPQDHILVTSGICYRKLPIISKRHELSDIERHVAVLSPFAQGAKPVGHVIPAHSPLLRLRNIKHTHNYYQTMLQGLRSAHAQGRTLEYVQKDWTVHRKFRHYHSKATAQDIQARQETNIERLWNLLRKETARSSSPDD